MAKARAGPWRIIFTDLNWQARKLRMVHEFDARTGPMVFGLDMVGKPWRWPAIVQLALAKKGCQI
jgi:hypothetical protein